MQTACAAHWCRLRAARQKDVRLAVLARFQPDLLCRHTPRVVKTALSLRRYLVRSNSSLTRPNWMVTCRRQDVEECVSLDFFAFSKPLSQHLFVFLPSTQSAILVSTFHALCTLDSGLRWPRCPPVAKASGYQDLVFASRPQRWRENWTTGLLH